MRLDDSSFMVGMDEMVCCRWSMDYTVLESAMSWVVPPSEA